MFAAFVYIKYTYYGFILFCRSKIEYSLSHGCIPLESSIAYQRIVGNSKQIQEHVLSSGDSENKFLEQLIKKNCIVFPQRICFSQFSIDIGVSQIHLCTAQISIKNFKRQKS